MKTTKINCWFYSLILTGLAITTAAGCGKDVRSPRAPSRIDYSQVSHWLSKPVPDKSVDVFYRYPTCWSKANNSDPNICAINNPSMQKGAVGVYNSQATMFEPFADVFAPYYRQAEAPYTLQLPLDQREKFIAGTPTLDATDAFDTTLNTSTMGGNSFLPAIRRVPMYCSTSCPSI